MTDQSYVGGGMSQSASKSHLNVAARHFSSASECGDVNPWPPLTAPTHSPHSKPPLTAPTHNPHSQPPLTAPTHIPHTTPTHNAHLQPGVLVIHVLKCHEPP